MRNTADYLNLECTLTNEELIQHSKKLSENINEKRRIEGEMKTFASQKKADIAVIDAEIEKLTLKISTGKEFKKMKCGITYDWDRRKKYWIREDTGEVCKSEDISELDYQEEIQLPDKNTIRLEENPINDNKYIERGWC